MSGSAGRPNTSQQTAGSLGVVGSSAGWIHLGVRSVPADTLTFTNKNKTKVSHTEGLNDGVTLITSYSLHNLTGLCRSRKQNLVL